MPDNLLQEIINNFSPEAFIHFFRSKNRSFRPSNEPAPEYNDDQFTDALYLGVIPFNETDRLVIYSFKVNRALTERAGKKAQYEKGKKILRQKQADAGIFIFYDEKGDFRFSLIFTDYSGTRRRFSYFKRFTYYVSPSLTNKTFLKQVGDGDFSSIEKIKEAFSVEKVTDEFFAAYRYALNEVIIKSLAQYKIEYRIKHSFAQQLLSRILFIYFLQRKGWLKWKDYKQDEKYLRNLWLKYKQNKNQKNTFYSIWLQSLFFGAFNKKSNFIDSSLPEDIHESFVNMPFLNGGLFSKNELDELNFNLPDKVFEWLFEPDEISTNRYKGFLEIFNFTIDEASPDDVEVAVDPEMLGKVYESLINEEERGEVGIFYTPRVEIDFMSRLSLVEYLHQRTSLQKSEIIDIIFNPSTINEINDLDKLRSIKTTLDKVKIADPACGSASFLVGMMNILVELHTLLSYKITGKEENPFALKEKIILENLYGVDVKDWAVMVGELRLWLSLILETEEKSMNIYVNPLLPNLSFKIRQGDSLVEEIGSVFINLRGDALKIVPKPVQQKISDLVDKKAEFFSSKRSADLKEKSEIEYLEIEIFKEIIQAKINELNSKLSSKTQVLKQLTSSKDLFGEKSQSSKNELKKLSEDIEELQNELSKYHKAFSAIGRNGKKDYFLWELDFAEVFVLNGGFDIVIGNPPYVRQELIAPPLENENDYGADAWRELKKQYKDKLIKAALNVWQSVKKIDKKSDLYVFFYYQGLSLLNDNGIFCFINSNSWLDVGYGAGLQEFLLKNMKPIYIIDNIAKRSFKQADVNTVIVLIQKPPIDSVRAQYFEPQLSEPLKFIAFKKPFEEAITPEVLKEIEKADKPIFDHPVYRIYPKTKKELLEEGVEYPDDAELELQHNIEQLPYIGNKWGGKYLRAPEIYFKILEKGKDKLVRLGDIAEVRFGIKTGANEFFYLKPVGMTVKQVVEISEKNPQALIKVKNGAGWEGEIEAEFLKPVIKSPRELKTIMVRIEDLNYLVFMCHKSKKELQGTKALEYIEWGEKQKYNQRPTCRSRNLWWDLGTVDFNIVYPSTHNPSWFVFLNREYFCMDKVFYGVKTENFTDIWVQLNLTIGFFQGEFYGYSLIGGGGSFITVEDLSKILVMIFPGLFKKNEKVLDIFSNRGYKYWYEELGFDPNRPIREQEPNPLPDRKELDDIVFDALGLTEEERKEVYWAVAELVKARLDKARSV